MVKDSPFEPHLVDRHRLTLLPDGPGRLEALIALIEGAETSLRFLYYIWETDETGRRVRDALVAAQARGVTLSLLVDGFGAANATDTFFQPLIDAGARFCRFVPRLGRRYLLRNHQKLALADGERAIIGGFNIADEYFGTVEEQAWRDLGLLVEGPDVAALAGYFDAVFGWARTDKGTIRQLRRMLGHHSRGEGRLQWLFGGPTRRLSPWAKAVKNDLVVADRLDLIAAYFAPNRAMVRRIYAVARRGTARVITAGISDNPASTGAARHFHWRLLRRGVQVFEYQPTKLHTKLIVIGDRVHIGSANFDLRSLYLNLEMMLRVDDAGFAERMRRYVDGEIEDSREVTREEHRARRTWWNRWRWALSYFIVAIADYTLARRLNFGRGRIGQ